MKIRPLLLTSFILIVILSLIGLGLASDTLQKKTSRITSLPDRISTQGYFPLPRQLSLSGQYAFWPALAINSEGVLMVCYAVDDREIYYTMSFDQGVSWTTPVPTYSIIQETWNMDLDADADGNFHLCYADGASTVSREIYHREFKNNQWNPKTQISSSTDNSAWCRISCDGNKVHIVWYQELGWPIKPTILLRTRNESGVWSASEDVTQDPSNGGISPCVSAYGGNIYVAWQRQIYNGGSTLLGTEVVFKEKRGNVWQPTKVLGKNTWPGILADTIGYVHVVYPDGPQVNYRRKDSSDLWSQEEQINTIAGIAGFYDFAFKNNTLICAYIATASREDVHYSVWYRTRQFSQGWDPWGVAVETDEGGFGDLPEVVMDDEGYAHIVWADWHTFDIRKADTIWYNKFLVGGPATPFLLLDKSSFSFSVTQGDEVPQQKFKVKNSGPGTINFQVVTPIDSFITATPTNGTSSGEWVEITLDFDSNLPVGLNTGTVQVTSEDADNSPVEVKVFMTILPPPILPPSNFKAVQELNSSVFFREYVNHLTWEANSANEGLNITQYRITMEYEKNGTTTTQTFDVEGTIFEYTHHNVDPAVEYTYKIQAVNDKGAAGQTATVIIGD